MSEPTADEWAQGRAIVAAMEGAQANGAVSRWVRVKRLACARFLKHDVAHLPWRRGDTLAGRGWVRDGCCLRCAMAWTEWTTAQPGDAET